MHRRRGVEDMRYLREKATSSPGMIISPNPMILNPPQGSNIRGILSSMGIPSSPLPSPRATYNTKQRTWLQRIGENSFVLIHFKIQTTQQLTTIITLLWNHRLDKNTQNMSYKNEQLSKTVPT